jgi:adenylyltransferase/sulfurtransferase
MILNEHQIERYSRQIIVPRVGGRAQERLLGAHLAIIAEARDAEMALAYLAGAGVGGIMIHPADEPASYGHMVERVRDLNPEILATVGSNKSPSDSGSSPMGRASLRVPDLILALIGSVRAADVAESVCRTFNGTPVVIARLDAPARVAVLPAPPPCALCAGADLWSKPGDGGTGSGMAAMLAVVETFKLLAGFDEHPAARLFEFSGYSVTPRSLERRPDGPRCECEIR